MSSPSEARVAFEDAVVRASKRKNKQDAAVGYYVSLAVIQAYNACAPPEDQVDEAQVDQLPLFHPNARMFNNTSFDLHRATDALILTECDDELPERLKPHEFDRLKLICKHANHEAFKEVAKEITNSEKLLKRIQDTLGALIAKYSPSPVTTRSQAAANVATSPETPAQAKPSATISPVAKPVAAARPKAARAVSRLLFPAIDEPTIDSIKSETGCHRAYEIFLSDPLKFLSYLICFKNANMDLATEISHRCKCKKKVAIRKWIRDHIGPIPESKAVRSGAGGRSSRRAFYVRELRELALVAAAITVYGEVELSRLLDSESLKEWQNIALVSDECRNNPRQLECLKRAGLSDMKRTYHAAHYLPLDLAIQWNKALAPEYRLSAACFLETLNLQCNLKAVRRRVNVKDHRKAESFIAAFILNGSPVKPKSISWAEALNINGRCVEIAKKVRSPEIHDALFEAGGEQFIVCIQQTFEQIEAYFKNRGFAFGKIWDHRPADKKTRDLLMHTQLKGVIKERHEEHTSPTPELLD